MSDKYIGQEEGRYGWDWGKGKEMRSLLGRPRQFGSFRSLTCNDSGTPVGPLTPEPKTDLPAPTTSVPQKLNGLHPNSKGVFPFRDLNGNDSGEPETPRTFSRPYEIPR